MTQGPRALLERMFRAAVASAQPETCVPRHLPAPPRGRLIVVGAGKASAAMARAVEDHWRGDLSGLVITRYGYGDSLEGEAREMGRVMAGIAVQIMQKGQPFTPPCVLLSGGETTVTVRGAGRGGRNVEFLLGLGVALGGRSQVHAMACDTDGVDGSEDIAGAYLSPDSLARAAAAGIDARDFLDGNDAHTLFRALGDSVVTGPTRTNVNDFRAIIVGM